MSLKCYYFAQMNLKIICANIVGLLNTLRNADIGLTNVKYGNDIEIYVTISRKDHKKITSICEKYGASVKVIDSKGIFYGIRRIVNRPVLVGLFLFLFIINIFLPRFVLFLTVEGNETIPTKKILESVYACGIQFGSVRKNIRSESMKNTLLEKIPELQWTGINTSGCTAIISVKEKSGSDITENEHSVGNIVATHDGIIQNMTVLQGNPVCSVGQAVVAGQTLVSGYTDCGIVTKATRANAEITALTSRVLSVVSPVPSFTKSEVISRKTKYSLQIGKKIINFSKDSGILGVTCDKIYSKKYWHLPGGFQLPVCVVKETITSYSLEPRNLKTAQDGNWLLEFAQSYLRDTMIAGKILSSDVEVGTAKGAALLKAKFTCCEMIGQIKYEQMIMKDENND